MITKNRFKGTSKNTNFFGFLMFPKIGGTGFPARGDRLESLSHQIQFSDFMVSGCIFRGFHKYSANLLRNNRGFSLIEALMAFALLSFGILAIVGTSGVVMDKNEDSRKKSIAITLSQDKIEYIKGLGQAWLLDGADGLDSPDLVSGTWTANPGGETVDSAGNAAASGSIYDRTWTISPVAGSNFLYEVTVNMSWEDKGTQTLQLITRITQ